MCGSKDTFKEVKEMCKKCGGEGNLDKKENGCGIICYVCIGIGWVIKLVNNDKV
jgi:hypothetical protein